MQLGEAFGQCGEGREQRFDAGGQQWDRSDQLADPWAERRAGDATDLQTMALSRPRTVFDCPSRGGTVLVTWPSRQLPKSGECEIELESQVEGAGTIGGERGLLHDAARQPEPAGAAGDRSHLRHIEVRKLDALRDHGLGARLL
jgi:hypothetical protein